MKMLKADLIRLLDQSKGKYVLFEDLNSDELFDIREFESREDGTVVVRITKQNT
jgi:hypothetical protein